MNRWKALLILGALILAIVPACADTAPGPRTGDIEALAEEVDGLRGDLLGDVVGGGSAACLVRDLPEVTKRAGNMAFEDLGVQVRKLSGANGGDEIGHVVSTAAKFLDHLAIVVVDDPIERIAVLALCQDTDLQTTIHVHRATPIALAFFR